MVAGGHTTNPLATITYAKVIYRENFRIALTMAELNDSEVKVADIQNAYITAPVSEKIWTVMGKEFGQDAGNRAIIVRDIYGLKSAGIWFEERRSGVLESFSQLYEAFRIYPMSC